MSDRILPESFGDLEALAIEWALQTEVERSRKRLATTIGDLQAFYDTVIPRMEPIVEYLNQFPLDALPPDAEALLNLSLSFMEISTAVELFGSAQVPNGFEPERYAIHQ